MDTHYLNDLSVTNQIEYTGSDKILILNLFVSYLSRKGPALSNVVCIRLELFCTEELGY